MKALAHGLSFVALAAAASAQTSVTVPAAHAASDAVRHLWLAGAGDDMRQQVLIGASHLGALVGKQLTAIELRRDANADAYEDKDATKDRGDFSVADSGKLTYLQTAPSYSRTPRPAR